MITLKFKYTASKEFYDYLKLIRNEYTNVIRFAYNRFYDNLDTKEIKPLVNYLNNISNLNSRILDTAIIEAKGMYSSDIELEKNKLCIFGGKSNFIKRAKNIISKEEYSNKKLRSIQFQGDIATNGNRHIEIYLESLSFLFKLNKKKFNLEILTPKKNIKKTLENIQKYSSKKLFSYGIKLDAEYIYLTYDKPELLKVIETHEPETVSYSILNPKLKQGRILGIDLNPNYVGLAIIDFKNDEFKVIHKQMYKLNGLTDSSGFKSSHPKSIYKNNKLKHETLEISKSIISLCKHFKVQYCILEELKMESNDKKKGKNYNRLCNNKWDRNLIINQLKNNIPCLGVKIYEVTAAYSSYIGNLQYNSYDCVNAAIEIARRGFQYKIGRNKDMYFPLFNIKSKFLHHWKETENSLTNEYKWISTCSNIKNSKERYRVSLDECDPYKGFKFKSYKSSVNCYTFY